MSSPRCRPSHVSGGPRASLPPQLPREAPMKVHRLARIAAAAAVVLAPIASAQMTEDTARQAAQEVRMLVSEGTGVIGDLQPAINAGKAERDQVSPDALLNQFKVRYQKAAGAPLDTKTAGA